MFLKTNLFIAILISTVAAVAQVKPGTPANRQKPDPSLNITAGRAGEYELDMTQSTLNEQQLAAKVCANFKWNESDLVNARPLIISSQYEFFVVKGSSKTTGSEYDPGICFFDESTSRKNISDSEIHLTRMNQERCAKENGPSHLRSRDFMKATVTPNRIELSFEKLGAEPYTCIWNRKQ